MEYLGIYLTKDLKRLYTEKYKTMMREIKEDVNKKKDKIFLKRHTKVMDQKSQYVSPSQTDQ